MRARNQRRPAQAALQLLSPLRLPQRIQQRLRRITALPQLPQDKAAAIEARGRAAGAVGERAGPTWFFYVEEEPAPRPASSPAPAHEDEVDWGNPYDLLIHGIPWGPFHDMRR